METDVDEGLRGIQNDSSEIIATHSPVINHSHQTGHYTARRAARRDLSTTRK